MSTRCPHCFTDVPLDRAMFTCLANCPLSDDVWFSEWYGTPRQSRTFTFVEKPENVRNWSLPAQVACRTCGGPTGEVCVVCHFPFPPEWRRGTATCIALAGARYTGKSMFVGVAKPALESMVEKLGGAVTYATEATRSIYRSKFEEVLQQRGLLDPTRVGHDQDAFQREPLIFGLGRIGGLPRYLVFRDVAGEDLENYSGQKHLRFFANASLVLFLFDPTKVDEVRDRLKDLLDFGEPGGDPTEVLTSVIQLVRGGNPKLAIALSKFDILQTLGTAADGSGTSAGADWARIMANPGAAFNRDALAATSFDQKDADLVDAEVRSLLTKLYATGLVNAVKDAPVTDKRFFVLSALGANPTQSGLHVHGIATFRVLDPIRWALASDGVIPLVNPR